MGLTSSLVQIAHWDYMTSPARERFDELYENGTPAWVIGEPQPAIVELEQAGLIRGKVLDPGCGPGEHTILLTALGYDVLGIDFAQAAIDQARANAAAKGVDARFEVADAMKLSAEPRTTRSSTARCFTSFEDADRARYVTQPAYGTAARRHSARARALRCGPRLRAGGQRGEIRTAFARRTGSSRRWTPPTIAASLTECTPRPSASRRNQGRGARVVGAGPAALTAYSCS